jgi:hypothetical protein
MLAYAAFWIGYGWESVDLSMLVEDLNHCPVPDQKGGLTDFISLAVLLESFLGMWLVTT